MILAPGDEVREEDLPPEVRPRDGAASRSLGELEKGHVLKILEACGGNQQETA